MHEPIDQKENPDSWSDEIGVEGIEALPKRVDRYSKAKKGALDTAKYMGTLPKHQAIAKRVHGCGDYLLFRHFFTIDAVKLHAASFCMKHLLCPLCAIRRGAKALGAYLDRFEAIKRTSGHLRPFLVTLTVKDGSDLRGGVLRRRGQLQQPGSGRASVHPQVQCLGQRHQLAACTQRRFVDGPHARERWLQKAGQNQSWCWRLNRPRTVPGLRG